MGARVMAVKNDASHRWINGSLGTVINFHEKGAYVRFDRSNEEYLVERAVWEKVRQIWNASDGRIEKRLLQNSLNSISFRLG